MFKLDGTTERAFGKALAVSGLSGEAQLVSFRGAPEMGSAFDLAAAAPVPAAAPVFAFNFGGPSL